MSPASNYKMFWTSVNEPFDLDLYLLWAINPTKFQINCSNSSWDIEQEWKSKTAALRPYWIADHPEICTWALPYMSQYSYQISNQMPKWFLRYSAETKIQDGGLVAIFHFWSSSNSYLSYSLYRPITLPNFKSIAPAVREISNGNENSRWLPCAHIGFLITLKFVLELSFIWANIPTKR